MIIEFDGIQIDSDIITSVSYDTKMFNDNDTFTLGQTVCDTLKLTVVKEGIEEQPDVVTVNDKDYIVDNIEEDDTSYIYTLTDEMVNFNFRYDAQPLIEASEHTEPDGTKYVTLLELVQDICFQANLSLITENFIGNDKHITWYDNTVTAREYIGMVAELNGGYAVIDEGLVFKRLTNGEIKTITGEPNVTIQDGTDTSLVSCNIEGNSYQEDTPSPTSPQDIDVVDEAEINVLGKNLYEGSQDFSGTWNNSANWTTDDNTYNNLVVKKRAGSWNGINKELTVESGKTYIFSVYIKSDEARQVALYTSGGTSGITTSKNINATTEWTRYDLKIVATASGTVKPRVENTSTSSTNYTYICGYQFEESTTMTEYAPYSNITTTIDLQNNFIAKIGNYKDELNIDALGNVILTKRIKKVTFVGSENWYLQRDTAPYVFGVPISDYLKVGEKTSICSRFKSEINGTAGSMGENQAKFRYYNDDDYSYYICTTIQSTKDTFKSWLNSHNVDVYYVLATPYTVNLGKADITLNEGTNYITFSTGLDTRNTIEYTSESGEYEINIEDCESYKIGDYHKITRVAIENGIFEPVGTEEGNTLYLNANNVYITEQNDLNNIYALVRGFEYYSLEIKKGDLDIVHTGECIALVMDKPYKTYSQIEANYNGGWYGKYHFITGSNKQEETAVYNGTEDNYKRLKFQVDRDKNEINILVEKTDVMGTNIDEETGDIRAVKTTTKGFTFNDTGLNITQSDNSFKTLIDETGMYNYDSNNPLAEFTKDGAKIKDLDIYGYNKYGEDEITDEPMFVAILYTNENNEEGYGHFYNR